MPKSTGADWNYAFTLFTQGLSLKEIADQLHVTLSSVKAQSARKGWSNQVATARATIQTAVTKSTQTAALTIQERAESWIDATVSDIERTVDTLTKLKVPKNLNGLRKHEEVWGMHVKRGRSTFGLDQQGANIQVNIGMSGQMASVEPVSEPEARTIDIAPIQPQST
jgi:hypothetical protein